ncbi:hypothetical protein [Streptomyces bacillaris]|uniref:hypothetical protein n=1 Tax=Streptomyces bacillaris TaxID=68179 RepID=UPI00346019DF
MTSTITAPPTLPAAAQHPGVQPTPQETCDAAGVLSDVLRAAGLTMLAPIFYEDERGPFVQLSKIDADEATELARLVRKGMKRSFQTALDLHAAVRAHGLDNFPAPVVRHARIHLGDVSVPTADRLACILGAPPQPAKLDITEWPEAWQVVDRLSAAFNEATGGGLLDMGFHPRCERCEGEPVIVLGSLKIKTARRLVRALQFGAP